MQFPKPAYFLNCFLLMAGLMGFALRGQEAVSLPADSQTVQLRQPSDSKEQEVFASKDLSYDRKKEKDENTSAQFFDWLQELFSNKDNASAGSFIARALFWTFVVGGFILLLWVLLRSEFSGAFRRRGLSTSFSFSDVEESLKDIDFKERIRRAIAENDYRMAIRLDYLQQLNALNEKGLIYWEAYKTNIDYTHELSETALRPEFIEISKIYDYVWYGQMELQQARYATLEKEFREFEKQVAGV